MFYNLKEIKYKNLKQIIQANIHFHNLGYLFQVSSTLSINFFGEKQRFYSCRAIKILPTSNINHTGFCGTNCNRSNCTSWNQSDVFILRQLKVRIYGQCLDQIYGNYLTPFLKITATDI